MRGVTDMTTVIRVGVRQPKSGRRPGRRTGARNPPRKGGSCRWPTGRGNPGIPDRNKNKRRRVEPPRPPRSTPPIFWPGPAFPPTRDQRRSRGVPDRRPGPGSSPTGRSIQEGAGAFGHGALPRSSSTRRRRFPSALFSKDSSGANAALPPPAPSRAGRFNGNAVWTKKQPPAIKSFLSSPGENRGPVCKTSLEG